MLQSMGLQRIGHDLETENQQQPSLLFPINSLSSFKKKKQNPWTSMLDPNIYLWLKPTYEQVVVPAALMDMWRLL